jgi:phosphoglycolate phosphatase-like HAD superfamily hydrolase
MSVITAATGVLSSPGEAGTPESAAPELGTAHAEPDQSVCFQAAAEQSANDIAADEAAQVRHVSAFPESCSVAGLAVYVDVDETLLRHYGTRQIPIPSVIKQVKALHKQGAELYCWSSMGAAYARECAENCGVVHCFQAFLPKPQVIVDDQQPKAWRRILHVHPSQCSSQTTVDEYREELKKPRSL